MHIRILGPLEVLAEGRRIPLTGARPQVILAMLALEPNRVISMDRLLDAIWEDEPPSTARVQIHICVSGLRRTFSALGLTDVISTRPPGYILNIPVENIDAHQFEEFIAKSYSLVEAGKPQEAVTELQSALGLWYGTALDGLQGRIIRGGALQLQERRLAAVEEWLRLELSLGRHANLIGDLTVLVRDHPLRERLYAHLMVALYRSGRQAEALETYRMARATLVEELGIEPGDELRRLEQAILRGDGDIGDEAVAEQSAAAPRDTPTAAVQVIPRQLPAAIGDFTGRTGAFADIVDTLTGPDGGEASGTVPTIVISGRGGVGKTTLAVQVAHDVREHFPDGQLFADLRGGSGRPASALEILERFLRGLGVDGSAIPDTLDERAEIYRSRLGERRMLVLLDNVMSESQVTPLLPGSSGCAVVVTSRTRLTGLPGARRIELGVLESGRAVTLLERILGEQRVRDEPEQAAALAELCGHLPLAVRIAGAKLASRPHWQLGRLADRLRDENRRLDELEHGDLGIRASIEVSYQGLPGPAKRLLRLLSLLETPDFPGWVGACLLDEDPAEAEDLLEELVDAQLVDAGAGPAKSAPRYRFHDLIRTFARDRALAEDSAADRTASLRRALSAWLALAKEAHRREYGGDYTILHSGEARWSPPPALLERLSPHPMNWLDGERAALVAGVRQAAQLGFDELCWDLALAAETLFEARSYFDDWRSTTELALGVVRRKANPRGVAAMLYSLGSLRIFQLEPDAALEALEPALRLFKEQNEPHGWALVLRNLAYVDSLRGDTEQAIRRYGEALEVFKLVGDRTSEAHVLSNLARSLLDGGEYAAAETYLERALKIARDVGSRRSEAQVLYRLGESALRQGQIDRAGRSFTLALRIVRDGADHIGEAYMLYGLGQVYVREGRHDQAHMTLEQSLALAVRVGERLVEGRVRHELGELALARGRFGEAAGRLGEAVEVFRSLGLPPFEARALVGLAEASDGLASAEGAHAAEDAARAAWALLAGLDSVEADGLRDRLALRQPVRSRA
ncbi:BTAD domain-containing putative transcriptional regulator [Nonomuraea sp. NPDC049750]|uniref:AfsR/SARP family transcriptional regulator n=1 Tax=Nonomuraea sp. NPDC049750 TaxID=3154738 RepID=UPI0033F0E610